MKERHTTEGERANRSIASGGAGLLLGEGIGVSKQEARKNVGTQAQA